MDLQAETLVFVYGTLKPGGRYHDAYCGGFNFEGIEATTRGRLFDFPQLGYPGAVESETESIHGVLLRFQHPESEILPRLDKLEGYDPHRADQFNEYYRKQVEVRTESPTGRLYRAWCYFMTKEIVHRLGGAFIASGRWNA